LYLERTENVVVGDYQQVWRIKEHRTGSYFCRPKTKLLHKMIVCLNYSCNSLQLILTFWNGTYKYKRVAMAFHRSEIRGLMIPFGHLLVSMDFAYSVRSQLSLDHIWMVVNLNLWSNSFNESIVLFLRSNLSRISVDNRLIIVSNIQHLLQHNL